MLQNGREGVLLRVIEHSWKSDNTECLDRGPSLVVQTCDSDLH